MKKRIYRDFVSSFTDKGELVGVYIMVKGVEVLLGEVSPEKADELIKVWEK